MELINSKIDEIEDICKKYHVSLLYVFGSVLTAHFNQESDIDFIVYFEPIPLMEYADNFFDFMNELEKVLDHKIDLVSGKAMKNPYFIEEVEQTKQLIYGKDNQKVIV